MVGQTKCAWMAACNFDKSFKKFAKHPTANMRSKALTNQNLTGWPKLKLRT